jgi:5'-nucleotidase
MEATIKGMPGIAVSTVAPGETEADLAAVLRRTGEIAAELARQVLGRGLPPQTLLNVNVPGIDPAALRDVHFTRMGSRHYPTGELIRREDPFGRPYYWLGGEAPVDALDDGTDVGAVANGFVSVTPITLDMTNYAFLPDLTQWELLLTEQPAPQAEAAG